MNYRIAKDDSMYHLYFSVPLADQIDVDDPYSLNYEIKSSLDAEDVLLSRTINFPVHGIGKDQEAAFFHLEVPDADNYFIMFIKIKDSSSGTTYTYDIPLISESMYSPPDFMLFNKTTPECRDFIYPSDSIFLKSLDEKSRSFFVYHYQTDFEVADPPMYRLKKQVSKSMDITSTFIVNSDSSFVLDREGLYFIQSDTSTLSGIGIRVENTYYPKMTSVKQLIDPIIYLSTKEEIEKLLNAEELRSSFETFWLNLTKSEEAARLIIKKYYDRIEEANSLFTNYKEGWKTDMGMIYTIVGPPDEVYRSNEKESWYYKNPGKNQIVVFNFLHLKNLFTDKHYMLVRDSQYKSFWFKRIDDWRKGMN
jgi:GWxTD domain-containing protein